MSDDSIEDAQHLAPWIHKLSRYLNPDTMMISHPFDTTSVQLDNVFRQVVTLTSSLALASATSIELKTALEGAKAEVAHLSAVLRHVQDDRRSLAEERDELLEEKSRLHDLCLTQEQKNHKNNGELELLRQYRQAIQCSLAE